MPSMKQRGWQRHWLAFITLLSSTKVQQSFVTVTQILLCCTKTKREERAALDAVKLLSLGSIPLVMFVIVNDSVVDSLQSREGP